MVGLASVAEAGTVIEVQTTYFAEKRPAETARIYLDRGRARFDAIEDGRPTTLIFRVGDDGEPLCWIIDVKNGTYDEYTRDVVDRMSAAGARARQRYEEQLENAPPGRREELKQTIEAQGQTVPEAPADAEFKRIASGVRLGKWTCTQYEAYVRGEKQEDLWAADETLGLGASDIDVLREMGAFFSRFSMETNAFFQIGRAGEGGFDGFPVVVVEYENGRKRERSEVTSIRHEKLEPNVFEPPAGARQRVFFERP
jgi:hypothetical protein